MKRWLIVAAVVLFTGALLFGVRQYRPQEGLTDELLVYEVTPVRSVETTLPADTHRVVLTTWLVQLPRPTHEPVTTYSYAVIVEVLDDRGGLVSQQQFDSVSRVSGDPRLPIERGEFAARLVNSSDWVTDPRSRVVDVVALAGRRGRIRVRAIGEPGVRVLVRLARAEQRSELERQVVERTLGVEERRSLVARRSALGFADLPEQARERALSTWGRRLTARGRNGRDFVDRRVLIGDYRAAILDVHEPAAVPIGPRRRVALNVRGALALRVLARAGLVLRVLDPSTDEEPFSVVVGDGGQVVVPLEGEAPRTVSFWSNDDGEVRFDLPAETASRLLGQGRRIPRGQRVEVGPDSKRHRTYQLAEDDPVRFAVFPELDRFGISVRLLLESPSQVIEHGEISVRWRGADSTGAAFVQEFRLQRSHYEYVEQGGITERQSMLLRPPRGATELELTGSENTVVSVWTREPGVTERRLAPEYRVELPEEHVWRYAAHEVQTWAVLRATNEEGLERTERVVRVTAQARIEPLTSGEGEPLFPRVLAPRGTPLTRRVLRPLWYGASGDFPRPFWLPVSDESLRVRIAAQGPRARRLFLTYRAAEEQLGETLTVTLGKTRLERRLVSRRGELRIPAAPGVHQLTVSGLGESGLALVDAAPVSGREIVRQQSVHELKGGGTLVFEFERRPGELSAVILLIATADGEAPYRVSFRVGRGEEEARRGQFFKRMTTFEGTLSGVTGVERGALWEEGSSGTARWPAALARERIQIGDDLIPGRYRLTLTAAPGPRTYWIRGVVVGRVEEAK